MISENKINVTIITGFFGAGKTTLLNCILSRNKTKKFAIAENEFGNVSVDTELIKGIDTTHMFEFKQGCICCTIFDEYELVLQELASNYPDIDHLIIETTGISDPVSVINPFFKNPELQAKFNFVRTICVADAINYHIPEHKEIAEKQIAVADTVIISKTDLVSAKHIDKLAETIQNINPTCTIFRGLTDEFDFLEQVQPIRYISLDKTHKSPNIKIKTLTMQFGMNPVKENFIKNFEYFSEINKSRIFRIKGIINFKDEIYEFVLQGVGGSNTFEETDKIKSGRDSFIVLIGYPDSNDREEILSFLN